MSVALQSELLGLDIQELTALVQSAGEAEYRARQLFEAIYRQRVRSLEEISTLPRALRQALAQRAITVGHPRIEKQFESSDGTIRYLIAFSDGQSVETVWMPEGDGAEEEVPSTEYPVPGADFRRTEDDSASLGTRNSVLGTQ